MIIKPLKAFVTTTNIEGNRSSANRQHITWIMRKAGVKNQGVHLLSELHILAIWTYFHSRHNNWR